MLMLFSSMVNPNCYHYSGTVGRVARQRSPWSQALCVLFFVWLGLVIFARSKEGQDHFDVWSRSLASLWILFTTANFPDVMIDSCLVCGPFVGKGWG